MRPGLDGTSSLCPLSSIRHECRGPAQRCWQPPKQLILTQPKGTGSLRLKRRTLVLILRSALVARLHSYSNPSEDHPRRNCWHLKISAGAHMGAYYQLADANTEFLNAGTLPHSKIVQSARSGDVCDTEHTAAKEGGVFDRK